MQRAQRTTTDPDSAMDSAVAGEPEANGLHDNVNWRKSVYMSVWTTAISY